LGLIQCSDTWRPDLFCLLAKGLPQSIQTIGCKAIALYARFAPRWMNTSTPAIIRILVYGPKKARRSQSLRETGDAKAA
jgi:hypothetical protein